MPTHPWTAVRPGPSPPTDTLSCAGRKTVRRGRPSFPPARNPLRLGEGLPKVRCPPPLPLPSPHRGFPGWGWGEQLETERETLWRRPSGPLGRTANTPYPASNSESQFLGTRGYSSPKLGQCHRRFPLDGSATAGTWLGCSGGRAGETRHSLSRAAPPAPRCAPTSPTVQSDSAPCPPRARTAPTLGLLPPFARPASLVHAAPKLPLGPGDRPRLPSGCRAPGPAGRGPGRQQQQQQQRGAPSGRASPGTRGRGHPPGRAGRSGDGAGARSRPGLLAAAAAAAVTTGRSREQRFPPQRSAASDRPYTARELSPTPLPASVALSPPPPSVAGSPASARRRGGAAPSAGGCPDGGVPRESQRAVAGDPVELPQTVLDKRGGSGCRMGVGGLGNPGRWKSQRGASVFSSVKREEERVGAAGDAGVCHFLSF